MSVRLKELIEKTYQEEIELKNAQIQALQSRINPHFLNNALETINWEARMEGSEAIENMISALSVLLNASLGRKNRRLVSLQEELEVADGYIFFIQQRFGDSLTITRVIDPDAEGCIVPLLTVQPVLENAVEHGIAPAGGGEIRLSARQAANCLELKITNTGQFLRPEDRQRIDAALSGEAGEGNHLGLANIANRLRLLYGSQARLTVSGGPGEKTVVEIHVPQTTEEDPEGNQMIACQKKEENRND
jgi:two-component system sensor histidine kinase YesM